MITAELRRAILAAAGPAAATAAGTSAGPADDDPLLRPGPEPGSYTSSLPFRLARSDPRTAASALAARLAREPWIATARRTGPGYLTVTVTREALAGLAVRIARAGPACAGSDALTGRTMPGPPETDFTAAPDWPSARAALAAQLTARLAATAGATVLFHPERIVVPPPAPASPVSGAVAYAGLDAVRFALARMPPGGPPPNAERIARHVLGNPAYAVRYAHAAAAAVLRWAASLRMGPAGFQPRQLMAPPELALLDALSWLPERVAMAARRGRPDEFAGYLEELAARTIDTMSTTGFTTIPSISSERLWLADAARTGLAAGLGLLGIDAPSRL
jgi:arginyl-tRNA synthetase